MKCVVCGRDFEVGDAVVPLLAFDGTDLVDVSPPAGACITHLDVVED